MFKNFLIGLTFWLMLTHLDGKIRVLFWRMVTYLQMGYCVILEHGDPLVIDFIAIFYGAFFGFE